jgi:cell division ATPase FtsA
VALFEKGIAIDIGTYSIKGISFKFSLGKLEIVDCRYQNLESIDIPKEILEQDVADDDNLEDVDDEEESEISGKTGKKTRHKQSEGDIDDFDEAELDESDLEDDDENLHLNNKPKIQSIMSFIIESFIVQNWGIDNTFLINLPSEGIIIRDIEVPFHEPKKVLEVLPFELENLISITVDNCIIETNVWGVNKEGSATSLTFCVPKRWVNERTEFFINNNLSIKNISADSVTLSRLITDTPNIENNDYCSQLDLGGKVSIFNIIKNNELIFTRILNVGGDDFTEAISEILKVDWNVAEEIKLNLNIDLEDFANNGNRDIYKQYKITRKKLKQIYSEFLEIIDGIISEIEISISASGVKDPLPALYISGGGSRFTGLKQIFSNSLSTEKHTFLTNDYLPVADFPEPSSYDIFCNCTGMIYHQVYIKRRQVNFLKGGIKSLLKGQQDWKALKMPLISLALSLCLVVTSYILNIFTLQEQVLSAKKQLISIYNKSFTPKYKASDGDILTIAKKKVDEKKKGALPDPIFAEQKMLSTLLTLSNAMLYINQWK